MYFNIILQYVPYVQSEKTSNPSSPTRDGVVKPNIHRESAKLEFSNYQAQLLEKNIYSNDHSSNREITSLPVIPSSVSDIPEAVFIKLFLQAQPLNDYKVFNDNTKLRKAFELIADGYIQFDKKGSGAILKYILYYYKIRFKKNCIQKSENYKE